MKQGEETTKDDNTVLSNEIDGKYARSNNYMNNNFIPFMQPELDMISNTKNTTYQQKEVNDSSSQLILFGGTILVLAAAVALGVSMSNELGISLEWR